MFNRHSRRMGEREKIAAVVGQAKAAQTAMVEAEQRRAYEYQLKFDQNVHEMRDRLREIVEACAPKVRVTFSDPPASHLSKNFQVNIGGRSSLRKPFGCLDVSVSGSGFYVSDHFPNIMGRYVPTTGNFDSVEQVAASIRDVVAHCLMNGDNGPYQPPEWFDVLVAIAAFIGAILVWGLCGLIWGGLGIGLGWLAAIVAFKALRAMGWITLAVPVGITLYFLAR
ncbi:MAG TPA: hypothetical protein VE999_13260 [Gemmataceae bacterium]|nr:hypothetical protein [Gemmataceae bacterium]